MLLLGLAAPAAAQPVRMIVGYPAGAGADPLARTVAQRLAQALGEEIRVENRPGAGTTNAAHAAAQAAPDGRTLFFADTALLIAPYVYAGLRFDTLKSYAPVGGVAYSPLALVAHLSVKARTAGEMVAMAKADPGRLAYGSPGTGTVQHLVMEDFERRAGISLVHIPFRSAAAAIAGVLWGRVPFGVATPAAALAEDEGGSANAFLLEDALLHYFLLAPAGTPDAAIGKLSPALKTALDTKDLEAHGARPDWTAPGELRARLEQAAARWAGAARHAGVRATLP